MSFLLNHLKNNEIYPFFWNLKNQTMVRFLDLKRLQSHLEKSDISDASLETLLYGDETEPRYTGWTISLVKKIAAECGVEFSAFQESDEIYTGVILVPKGHSFRNKLQFEWNRFYEKTWDFRKTLRKKAIETKAHARSVFNQLPSKPLLLNLGAGDEEYPEYTKVDLQGRQDVFDNIVFLKKLDGARVQKIYTNHVLEHIPLFLIPTMLKRWRDLLAEDGEVVARIPNAKASVETLEKNWVEVSDHEIKLKGLPPYLKGDAMRAGLLDEISCVQMIYGWSNSTKHIWDLSNQHKTLWTPELAKKRFHEAGFNVIEARAFGTIQTLIRVRK